MNGEYGETVVLTKDKIIYKDDFALTMDYLSYPEHMIKFSEKNISYKDYCILCDAVNKAGLFDLTEQDMSNVEYPRGKYKGNFCKLDDGTNFKYITTDIVPAKEFSNIASLMLTFFDAYRN